MAMPEAKKKKAKNQLLGKGIFAASHSSIIVVSIGFTPSKRPTRRNTIAERAEKETTPDGVALRWQTERCFCKVSVVFGSEESLRNLSEMLQAFSYQEYCLGINSSLNSLYSLEIRVGLA